MSEVSNQTIQAPYRTFRNEGRQVWANTLPLKDGSRALGFAVCVINENLEHAEAIAEQIARLMTLECRRAAMCPITTKENTP